MFTTTQMKKISKNMVAIIVTATVISLLTILSSQAVATTHQKSKILVFGDSLSAGLGVKVSNNWATLLQIKLDTLGYDYKVVNASISGDTTSSGLRRLPRALKVHQPDIIIIELGANDGLRAIPVAVARNNLIRMIELAQAANTKVIIAGMQMPSNYGITYTNAFRTMFFEIAAETNSDIIPFFLKNIALNPKMMQADGLHPNTEAQHFLLENVWDLLEQNLVKNLEVAAN
jgi:acyl-CoA thioesterase I